MSVWRTLLLLGITIILACFVVKACASYEQNTIAKVRSRPLITCPAEELLKVKTAPDTPEQIMEYAGFTVSFNAETHIPNWVAWELLASEIGGPAIRKGKNFFQDSRIKGCPSTYDYRGSGYSRGHMAPAADMKWSEKAMNDCFTMANMCPQLHSLNSGAWDALENKCRQWAVKDSSIIIISGPVVTDPKPEEFIGDSHVAVPQAFFKVIAAPWANPPRGIAFIMPNADIGVGIQNSIVTIDSVESLTGHDFFTVLPDSVQNIIESQSRFHQWNKHN